MNILKKLRSAFVDRSRQVREALNGLMPADKPLTHEEANGIGDAAETMLGVQEMVIRSLPRVHLARGAIGDLMEWVANTYHCQPNLKYRTTSLPDHLKH